MALTERRRFGKSTSGDGKVEIQRGSPANGGVQAGRGGDGSRGGRAASRRPKENNMGVSREEPVVLASCIDGRRGASRR